MLILVPLFFSIIYLDGQLGKAQNKPKFQEMFSKSPAINWLSGARFFLFGARDVWFVVALPVYLQGVLQWSHTEVGTFMALWIIGYGVVQATTPKWTGLKKGRGNADQKHNPTRATAMKLALALAVVPALMAATLSYSPQVILVGGLLVFGVVFALNSAVHSYLIVSYADADGTSKDVGFYYMANAAGRLAGTVLSGWVYQVSGMEMTLWLSALMVLSAGLLVLKAQPVPKTA
jgi:predicted MFS family arabinose efflux permease